MDASLVKPSSAALQDGLRRAIAAAGSEAELARRLRISRSAVNGWKRVPAHWVIFIEQLTEIDRSILRPDLYPPRDGGA